MWYLDITLPIKFRFFVEEISFIDEWYYRKELFSVNGTHDYKFSI